MIVIDALVLANALGDDFSDGRKARSELLEASALAAPDLINVEVAAVLRKRWIAQTLSDERLSVAIDSLLKLPLIIYPTIGLIKRSLELRSNITAYDAVYVALAESLSVELLTSDRKLADAPGTQCKIRVIE